VSHQPESWGQRLLYAFVLILAVAYGVQPAASWLAGFVPLLIVIVLLLTLLRLVAGRRR
jgi:hypothetical protein